MTITPRFETNQNDTHVILIIKLPYVRVIGCTEFTIENCDFVFYCKPYLLKLTFPHPLVNDHLDEEEEGDGGKEEELVVDISNNKSNDSIEEGTNDTKATATNTSFSKYDPNDDNGTLTIHLAKRIAGTYFDDLDLISKLMQPKINFPQNSSLSPLIQVIDETTNDASTAASMTEEPPNELLQGGLNAPHYGFNNRHFSVFQNLREELLGIVELSNPDETLAEDRREMRIECENEKFDKERYLGDYYHFSHCDGDVDYIYEMAAAMKPHWLQQQDQQSSKLVNDLSINLQNLTLNPSDTNVIFTEKEREMLANLPSSTQSPSLSKTNNQPILLGLLDIIFGYAYDHRITGGEANCESPWTIAILSPTLSWLEDYDTDSSSEVWIACIRRSLIYPYIRYHPFSQLIISDVLQIIKGGRRLILRCLLVMRSILMYSELGYYVLNKLYIDEYCVWIQRGLTDDELELFVKNVETELEGGIPKELLGLDLINLECLVDDDGSDDESSSTNSSCSSESERLDDKNDKGSYDQLTKEAILMKSDCPTAIFSLDNQPPAVTSDPILLADAVSLTLNTSKSIGGTNTQSNHATVVSQLLLDNDTDHQKQNDDTDDIKDRRSLSNTDHTLNDSKPKAVLIQEI